jgi:two-component SAPR family response regulator
MADAPGPAELKGMKVLVVEDETLISMLFEDILAELDCEVVGPALNIRQATELAQRAEIDAAVLDVNLAGDPIFPVAEILALRGVPLVFSSGYGANGLPERWQHEQTLPKPFTTDEVARALESLKRQRALASRAS